MSREVAAWAIYFGSLGMAAIGMTLLGLVPADRAPAGERLAEVLPYFPMTFSFATVGALVASRRPANPIGWLLLAAGAVSASEYLTSGYAVFGLFGGSALPDAQVSGWLFSLSGGLSALPIAAVVFLFPDGRLANYRARIGLAVGSLGSVMFAIAAALTPGTLFNLSGVENPFGLAGQEALITALFVIASVMVVATNVLMVSAVYERYRVASPTERLQLKWFVTGVAFAAVVFIGSGALALVNWAWAKVGVTNAIAVIPIVIAIAILRHHLYDIDVVINRALIYVPTTALIALAFFAGIVVLQAALRPLTGGSELAVAISTLASFALFQPLRWRIQDAVDRRFYRSRYDAARTLDEFSVRLRDQVALDAVRAGLLDAVRETVQPAHASLWLRIE